MRLTSRGAFLAVMMMVVTGMASAHGPGKHAADAQMTLLHKAMQLYESAQVRIEAAFKRGDLKAADEELGRMIETIPDLKKSRPHKGLKHLDDFKRAAADFDKDLRQARTLAQQGNLDGAKHSFSRASQKCASCHAAFRD